MTKLLLMVIVAALAVAAFSIFALRQASAEFSDSKVVVTVNTTSNHEPDGDCEGVPNEGSGDCTLAEAIIAANEGRADVIAFRKSVFPKANPGVIYIDQEQTRNAELDGINGNNGCLPPIENQIAIDSTNTGVILDGDFDNDGDAQDCSDTDVWGTKIFPVANREGVIQVYANKNGFDFTLLGGKNFIIREFDGETDGINFNGRDIEDDNPDHIFGDILISGYIFQDGDVDDETDLYDSEDGIDFDETDKVISATFTNNNITADDDGIEVDASGDKSCFNQEAQAGAAGDPVDPCFKISSSSILANENTILADFDDTGAGDGFSAEIDAHLNGKLLIEVIDNPSIASKDDDAVDIEYCDDNEGCDAGQSEINVDVSRNNKLHGGESGSDACVEIDIEADEAPNSGGSTDVSVDVNDNGLCDAGGEDGFSVQVDICCDQSFSTSTININGNDDVIADEDAVDVEVEVGCGDGNESFVSVSENGSLEGQGNGGGHGVTIETNIGEAADGCDEDNTESDENVSTVVVNDNLRIDGGDAQGVEIEGTAGADSDGNGDDNIFTVEINNNGRIHGQEQGIAIDDIVAGSEEGDDGDDNHIMVTIDGNEDITGDDDNGIEVDASTGVDAGLTGDLPQNLSADDLPDGDSNLTQVFITNNENIEGNDNANVDGNGIEIDIQAGGVSQSSSDNINEVEISGNGEILGRSDVDGDGIDVDMEVCCQTDGLNFLRIENNVDIISFNDDGINTDLCCAGTNVVNIEGNGQGAQGGGIRGNGGDGIDYDVDVWHSGKDDKQPCPSTCGVFQMVNQLTILENEIFNSEEDGIELAYGAFQLPDGTDDQGSLVKSLISDNRIYHNRDHGIEIHSSWGLNIVNNEIFENGEDPQNDRGIEIDTDDLADGVQGNCNVNACIDPLPANHNLISKNSIYDNAGLGIDLVGDTDGDGDGDHGIGCLIPGSLPAPNDCIAFPVIQTLSTTKLVGDACAGCTVEIFEADATPADQLPLTDQHGEGRTFIATGVADEDGEWSFEIPCGSDEMLITATATDKEKNTSEFSRNFEVLAIPCTPTPTDTPTPTNTPTPTSTNTPTNTPTTGPTDTPVPAKLCGDVDDSGSTNSIDATLVLQIKAALIEAGDIANAASGDVDGSGGLTSIDAALILQLDAGLIGPGDLNCL